MIWLNANVGWFLLSVHVTKGVAATYLILEIWEASAQQRWEVDALFLRTASMLWNRRDGARKTVL